MSKFSPVLLTALACLSGCTSSSAPLVVDQPQEPTQEKLMKIGAAYTQFASKNNHPPREWADLRPALAQSASVQSERADEPWKSPRDGQPFVVCWGADLSKVRSWAKTTPVLAYEKNGQDGSRYVLTAIRSVELMSDQDFREASFPPGQAPRD